MRVKITCYNKLCDENYFGQCQKDEIIINSAGNCKTQFEDSDDESSGSS